MDLPESTVICYHPSGLGECQLFGHFLFRLTCRKEIGLKLATMIYFNILFLKLWELIGLLTSTKLCTWRINNMVIMMIPQEKRENIELSSFIKFSRENLSQDIQNLQSKTKNKEFNILKIKKGKSFKSKRLNDFYYFLNNDF